MIMRILACYLFHMSGYNDVYTAYMRLKYLRFNADKFVHKNLFAAFMICQFQFWSSIAAEYANILFMCRQKSLVDIIINYAVFIGISEMDNLYCMALRYFSVRDSLLEMGDSAESQLLDKFLTFKKEQAKENDPQIETSTFTNPIPKEQKWLMRVIIIFHTLQRLFYKSLYFYMFPYLVLFISYYVKPSTLSLD
jgi:hypothetical protein